MNDESQIPSGSVLGRVGDTRRVPVCVFLLVALVACSKSSRMPKGFEKLKLGATTVETLDIVYGDANWRDSVVVRLEQGGIVKWVKDMAILSSSQTVTSDTLAKVAAESDAIRKALKDTQHPETEIQTRISIALGISPYGLVRIEFERGIAETIAFDLFDEHPGGKYDDLVKQATETFGEACEPRQGHHDACNDLSCTWDLCDEKLSYSVNKHECSDGNSRADVTLTNRPKCFEQKSKPSL